MILPAHYTLIPTPHPNPPLFRDARARRVTNRDPRHLSPNWDQRLDGEAVPWFYFLNGKRTQIDPRGCPEGWEMRLDDRGKNYFQNKRTKRTTSTDPRGLPEGWEMTVHETGFVFFIDEKGGRRVEDPRKGMREEEAQALFVRDWNQWWLNRI